MGSVQVPGNAEAPEIWKQALETLSAFARAAKEKHWTHHQARMVSPHVMTVQIPETASPTECEFTP